MTWFPTAVMDAAQNGTRPALRVSTQYMETFLPVRPISSGTEIHTFANQAGILDLYSVGTDAEVYRLRRGQGAAAPYSTERLGISASQLYLFTVAGGDPDHPSVFGLDAQGRLTLSTWTDGAGYSQQTSQPSGATEVIRRFAGVRGTTGRIYVNVILDDGRLGANYYDTAKQAWGGAVWAPVQGPDGRDARVKTFAVSANSPTSSALFAIGTDDEVLFAEDTFRTSKLRKLAKKATHLSVVNDDAGLLCVFAVELGTGLLWVKRQKKYSAGGIQFDDWVCVDPGEHLSLGEVHANLRLDGRVEVFAAETGGNLRYSRQLSAGSAAAWTYLFPLHSRGADAIFTTGRNGSGYSEAYSVTADGEIYRFWQSPESEQWFSERLEVPEESQRLVSVPTHAAEFTAVDAQGLPVADADVVLNAAFLTTLWVDGRAWRSSLLDPVTLKTGANGRVVVHQRATALAAATLLVQTSGTVAGAPLKVEPNAGLQARLGAMDAAQVLDARDAAGNLLLPADMKDRGKVGESIAQITRRSMEIAQADGAAAPVQYHFAAVRGGGFQHRLNLAALNETAWEIDFSGGYPSYRDVGMDEARSYRAARLRDVGAGGFLGIDWGSVWSSIRSGVEWAIDGLTKIVVTIAEGVATVIFEIAGKVFEAILEVAQQALDFVEGVWNWLKVGLQKLYEWLAFLFNFKDFDRTAQGVQHTVGVILDFTADAVHLVRDRVEQGFTTLKKDLDSIVNDLLATLNGQGNPTMGAYLGQSQPDEGQSQANDHNLFLNAWEQNQGEVRATGGGMATAQTAALDDGIAQLLDKLRDLADNFQFGDGKQAFEESYAYFDAVGSDRDHALQLVLSGLVKAMEGAALFALDVAQGVVLSLFDLIESVVRLLKEALFEEWEIPVISQLYELFTGESLAVTPVKVMAWIVAIPSTILSKVVLGRGPFPDQAALDRFRSTFTADMLRRRVGLVPAAAAGADAVADAGNDWDPAWKENFLTAYSCVMFVRALVDPGQVMLHGAGKGLGPAGIVPLVLRFMSTGFTAPWALSAKAGAPNCTPGDPGFGVTIWICQLVLGPTRGLAIFKAPWEGETKIYAGELTTTLWGIANLIMTSVNFAKGGQTEDDKLSFARGLTNLIPGQTLRFLALPALNKPAKMIPAAVLAVLALVGYLSSFGIAIAQINSDGAQEPQLLPAR